jgi:uncharacterized membrane protein
MNLRLAIMELAARYQLSPSDSNRLRKMAGIGEQPRGLMLYVPAGLAVAAAVLGGLGIIFWIAANWETVSRATRFALLEGFFAVMCVGALLRPAARVPLGLLALLATGGLLAFFGQTYQTGADPWQLFAWWAALTLPLCLGVRHDALWTAWCVVTMTALSLWSRAEGGHDWTSGIPVTVLHGLHLVTVVIPSIALSPLFRKFTGAGMWSWRLSILLATLIINAAAIDALFGSKTSSQYYLGLVLLAAMAVACCRPALFDMFAVCVVALGLNLLIDAGIVQAFFDSRSSGYSMFLVIGLAAALLLGATVKAVLAISRSVGEKRSLP